MSHRPGSPRLAAVTAALVIASLVVGAPSVAGRDSGPAQRRLVSTEHPERVESPRAMVRSFNLRDLPRSRGLPSPYAPGLLGPGAGVRTTGAPALAAAAPPTEATITSSPPAFERTVLDGLADGSGSEPPDPWVAVGPEHVIQAVNTTFRVSNRAGSTVSTVDMFDFFGLGAFYDPGDVAYFDPRVIYDSLHGRWVAIEASFDCFPGADYTGTGYIDIALSDSADALGDWQVFSIPFAGYLPDYPGIGTSTDKVAFSSNLFALVPGGTMGCMPVTFSGTEIDVIAWSEFLGTGNVNVDYLWSQNFQDGAFPNDFFSWRPALQTPATSATIYAVAERLDEGVAYATITGTPAGGGVTGIVTSNLTAGDVIDPFADPSPPEQPGPDTIDDALSARPTDAIWQNNRLVFVSTYPCDPTGGAVEDRDCVRVSELNTSTATPSLTQDMLIAEDGADHYMGGAGFAGNGDLHLAWTRSSETAGQYPSSYTAYQLATDVPGELSAPALLAAGSGAYPGTRWGDYVGVAQDPQVPNAVWQGNQFSAGGSWWDTRVSQLQTGGSSYAPITPLRVVDSRTPTGVAGIFTASVPQSFQVAGTGVIPADAVAVTGNVTVVGQTAAGYVSITPDPTTTPPSSTINAPLGDIRANNFTSPLSAAGRLSAVYKAAVGKKTHLVVDITGYFVAGDAEATYLPLEEPVRVMDTRPAPNHVGPLGTFAHGVTQTLSIAGANDIPPEATAITGNLTVVNQTRAGYLSVTPDDPPGIPGSSTLNFPVGDIRANGLTADLNADGDLSITYQAAAGATANVILDVTGYYVPDTSGLQFYPLNPGRILDTRLGVVLSGLTGTFPSNSARTLDVDGHWGVPLGAAAITGNLTVVNQTAAGYVAVTPVAVDPPPTSSLNFPLGDIRANGITTPLSGGGTPGNVALIYKAVAGRTTHLILDLSGYFK